jgi:hemolysin D
MSARARSFVRAKCWRGWTLRSLLPMPQHWQCRRAASRRRWTDLAPKLPTKAFTQRLEIAADIESRRRELERLQVGSLLNRLNAQDQRIEMQRNLTDATGAAERASRELQQMIAERDSFEQQWKAQVSQELHERSRSLSDAKENLRKATLRHQLVELRAEQDAIVLTVAKVSVGSVMQSGDQFITLVPAASRLEIEARIAGADAGYIQEGQKVTIKFDTFPYVQYGTAQGSVRTLSADSFVGREETQRGKDCRDARPRRAA